MPFRRHPDTRSWALLFLAGICATRAITYGLTPMEPLPGGLKEFAPVLPVWFYVGGWAGTAAILTTVALRRWPVKWWYSISVGMPLVWGTFNFTGAIAGPHGEFVRSMGNAWLWWFVAGAIMSVLVGPPKRRWG